MESKKKKFLYSVFFIILALTIVFSILFSMYWPALIAPILSSENLWIGVVAIIGRAAVLGILSFFLYRKWWILTQN